MLIVDRIMNLVDDAGLTQESFAAKLSEIGDLKITKQTITDWKSGKSNSYFRVVAEIAKLFETSTDYILTGKMTSYVFDKNDEEIIAIMHKLSDDRDKIKLIGATDIYAKTLPSYSESEYDLKQEASNE